VTASLHTTPGSTGETSLRERRSGKTSEPTPYDFRRPVTLSREHGRMLQIAFETFARQVSSVMTSALRSVCQATLTSVEQQTYTEYVDSLEDLTYMTVLSIEPIQQPAVLEMPLAATMTCVDHLLGGPGGAQQPERPLTEIEANLVGGLFERLVAEVRYAFASLVPLEPVITGVEYSPQLAQVATSSDAMIVARFQLRHGETDHTITLCLSFAGLLPYLNAHGGAGAVSERDRLQREQASARLAAVFQQVPIDVSIKFRATSADPVELAGLRVGDIVRLKHPAQAPLDVTAADVVFAHATAGSQGTRLACLVVAPPTQESC
jgi:flagellar motor switch protein FliM